MKKKRWLAIAVASVALLAVGYAVYWHVVAGKIDAAVENWVAFQRQSGMTLNVDRTPVGGFPFAFRIIFHRPGAKGAINGQSFAWSGPDLTLSLSPLDLETIRFDAAGHHTLDLSVGSYTLDADSLQGGVGLRRDGTFGAAAAEVGRFQAAAPDGRKVTAAAGKAQIELPAVAPKTDGDAAAQFAATLQDVTLPEGTTFLTTGPISDFKIAGTIKGPLPVAPVPEALAAWRDQGGTLDIRRFTVTQAPLTVSGSATLALDQDLQPIGAADLKARGLAPALDILAQQGRIKAGDATRFKLFVKGAERSGADGVKEVATGLSLQANTLYWGPFKIVRLPRIAWR